MPLSKTKIYPHCSFMDPAPDQIPPISQIQSRNTQIGNTISLNDIKLELPDRAFKFFFKIKNTPTQTKLA